MIEKKDAIPISDARLCLNCDNIIQTQICPICLSKKQLFIVQFLGSLKLDEVKRFVIGENGEIKTINIQPKIVVNGEKTIIEETPSYRSPLLKLDPGEPIEGIEVVMRKEENKKGKGEKLCL